MTGIVKAYSDAGMWYLGALSEKMQEMRPLADAVTHSILDGKLRPEHKTLREYIHRPHLFAQDFTRGAIGVFGLRDPREKAEKQRKASAYLTGLE